MNNNNKVNSDNQLLEQMRAMMKEFVVLSSQQMLPAEKRNSFHHDFEMLRDQLHDPLLKDFSSFDLMERICKLEKNQENC